VIAALVRAKIPVRLAGFDFLVFFDSFFVATPCLWAVSVAPFSSQRRCDEPRDDEVTTWRRKMYEAHLTVGELGQGVAADAIHGPLIHRDRTQGLVEIDRSLVPVEHRPFEPSATTRDGDSGEVS
jgi:hypothetical protein